MFGWRISRDRVNREEKTISDRKEEINRLREELGRADAVIIGAGAGLSASAGFVYTGERFDRYFKDFAEKYQFRDMYSGGFYPYSTLEEHWAYWSRYIYINRYMKVPTNVYQKLYDLVKDKDYFVLTTNVDHCFQNVGFDKHRLFYTQGDYGLFQCSKPCHADTYDNEKIIREMVEAQGYQIGEDGTLNLPEYTTPKMRVPSEWVPYCPKCGAPMSMNLRADDTFVEDEGWHRASERYADFLRRHEDMKVLFIETGVGYNTPVIIKFGFQAQTRKNKRATYACINLGQAFGPDDIKDQSIYISADCGDVINELLMNKSK